MASPRRIWKTAILTLADSGMVAGPALANPGSISCPFGQAEVISESSGDTSHLAPDGAAPIATYANGDQILFRATPTARESTTWRVVSTEFIRDADARCIPV